MDGLVLDDPLDDSAGRVSVDSHEPKTSDRQQGLQEVGQFRLEARPLRMPVEAFEQAATGVDEGPEPFVTCRSRGRTQMLRPPDGQASPREAYRL